MTIGGREERTEHGEAEATFHKKIQSLFTLQLLPLILFSLPSSILSLALFLFLTALSSSPSLALFQYRCLAHLASARKQFEADYSPATPTRPCTQTFTMVLTHISKHTHTNINARKHTLRRCTLATYEGTTLPSANDSWLEHSVQCKYAQTCDTTPWQDELPNIPLPKSNIHFLWQFWLRKVRSGKPQFNQQLWEKQSLF